MLGWSHGELIAFVSRHAGPGGALELTSPLPAPVDVELVATTGPVPSIEVAPAPGVRPARPESGATRLFCAGLERRAATLKRVLRAGLASLATPTSADVADAEGLAESVVERIVRGRRVSVDGRVVPFETIIDPDALVVTTRRSAIFDALLAPCRDPYGLGDASLTEWPNNVLSTRTIVYEGGVIAREGDEVVVRYDPAERRRCERLAAGAATVAAGMHVDLKSEADGAFAPFFRVAPPGSAGPPAEVDEAFVRWLFGETICPLDAVRVEPLDVTSTFFREDVLHRNAEPEHVARWRALIDHFAASPELVRPSFASVGFADYAPARPIAVAARPPGFASRGSCLPRLVFAFTERGSVVGLFAHVVWT